MATRKLRVVRGSGSGGKGKAGARKGAASPSSSRPSTRAATPSTTATETPQAAELREALKKARARKDAEAELQARMDLYRHRLQIKANRPGRLEELNKSMIRRRLYGGNKSRQELHDRMYENTPNVLDWADYFETLGLSRREAYWLHESPTITGRAA